MLRRLFIAAFAFLSILPAAEPSGKQPVYLMLYSRFSDHIRINMSENRLQRLMHDLEKLHKDYPTARIEPTFQFSGALTERLFTRNGSAHLIKKLLDFKKRGLLDVGYEGFV